MAANADIFVERETWRGPLAISAVLHAALFGSMILYAAFFAADRAAVGETRATAPAAP